MIVDDPDIHLTVLADIAVIDHARERRQRMQRLDIQRGINRYAVRAEIIAALAPDVEAEPPHKMPQWPGHAGNAELAAEVFDAFDRRRRAGPDDVAKRAERTAGRIPDQH